MLFFAWKNPEDLNSFKGTYLLTCHFPGGNQLTFFVKCSLHFLLVEVVLGIGWVAWVIAREHSYPSPELLLALVLGPYRQIQRPCAKLWTGGLVPSKVRMAEVQTSRRAWRVVMVEAEMITPRSADWIETQRSSVILPLLWYIWGTIKQRIQVRYLFGQIRSS